MKVLCYIFPEHISSIIASMLRNCQGTQRQRLLNKFTENDHEKVCTCTVKHQCNDLDIFSNLLIDTVF